jgi:hypothetical protein
VEGLPDTRYCNFQDILDELSKTETDDEGNALGALLSDEQLQRKLDSYVVSARLWIEADAQAGHDFDLHENVQVYLDGTGKDVMGLAQYGFYPLVDLTAMTVDGFAVRKDQDFTVTSRGIIRRNVSTSVIPVKPVYLCYPLFSWGTQNVVITLTWGYQTCPKDILDAQTMKVVAEILRFVARSDSESGEMPGGVSQIRFGSRDLWVNNGATGRYAQAISDLEREARQICWRHRIPKVTGPLQMRIF